MYAKYVYYVMQILIYMQQIQLFSSLFTLYKVLLISECYLKLIIVTFALSVLPTDNR